MEIPSLEDHKEAYFLYDKILTVCEDEKVEIALLAISKLRNNILLCECEKGEDYWKQLMKYDDWKERVLK